MATITAQWDDYGGFRYKSREPLTFPSVMVDGLAIDVKNLFIAVTSQHRSLDRLDQRSAKWDPRTGHWIRALAIFGDPPKPPVFDFSAGTAGKALRDLASECSIGRITPDESASPRYRGVVRALIRFRARYRSQPYRYAQRLSCPTRGARCRLAGSSGRPV
jgi:hypothetical protein